MVISLREALRSALFLALQNEGIWMDDHAGGYVLSEKKELAEALMKKITEEGG